MTEYSASDYTLSRLLYFSRARADTLNHMASEFPEILSVAQRRNAQLHITGGLLACDGWFVQILEGPPASIETVFDSICHDHRHEDVHLVKKGLAAERFFPEWSMCGRDLSSTDDEIMAVLEQGGVFDPRKLDAEKCVALLQEKILELKTMHRGDKDAIID